MHCDREQLHRRDKDSHQARRERRFPGKPARCLRDKEPELTSIGTAGACKCGFQCANRKSDAAPVCNKEEAVCPSLPAETESEINKQMFEISLNLTR